MPNIFAPATQRSEKENPAAHTAGPWKISKLPHQLTANTNIGGQVQCGCVRSRRRRQSALIPRRIPDIFLRGLGEGYFRPKIELMDGRSGLLLLRHVVDERGLLHSVFSFPTDKRNSSVTQDAGRRRGHRLSGQRWQGCRLGFFSQQTEGLFQGLLNRATVQPANLRMARASGTSP